MGSAADSAEGAPTKTDMRQWRSEVRGSNRAQKRAYDAGRRGEPSEPFEGDEDLYLAYSSGWDEARQRQEAASRSTRSGSSGSSGGSGGSTSPGSSPSWFTHPIETAAGGARRGYSAANEGAGALLSLVGFAIAVNYLRFGWAGVTGWVAAKFWNAPMGVDHGLHPTGGGPANPPAATGAPQPTRGGGQNLNPPGSGDTTSTPVL